MVLTPCNVKILEIVIYNCFTDGFEKEIVYFLEAKTSHKHCFNLLSLPKLFDFISN